MTVLTLQVTGKLEVYAYFIFFVSWTYVCSYMRLIKRSFLLFLFLSHLFIIFFKCTLLQIKLHFLGRKNNLCLFCVSLFDAPFNQPIHRMSASLPVLVTHSIPCVTSFILGFYSRPTLSCPQLSCSLSHPFLSCQTTQ